MDEQDRTEHLYRVRVRMEEQDFYVLQSREQEARRIVEDVVKQMIQDHHLLLNVASSYVGPGYRLILPGKDGTA